ncbi:MAG: hypothetical protein ACREJO_14475 [Phycisphaerales bacterium]
MNDLTAIAVFMGCLLVTLGLVPALERLLPRAHAPVDRTSPVPTKKEHRP